MVSAVRPSRIRRLTGSLVRRRVHPPSPFSAQCFQPLSLADVRSIGGGLWGQWAARHAACITHDDRTPQRTPDSVRPRFMASAPDTRVCHGSSFIPRGLWQRACRSSGISQHRSLRPQLPPIYTKVSVAHGSRAPPLVRDRMLAFARATLAHDPIASCVPTLGVRACARLGA